MALFDAFLKLDGIKGESADAKHKGEIDVMSFSWGMSQTGVSATGGGGGAGKVKVHDISFQKKTDAASPLLFLNCVNGAHIKEANFVVRKAGGEQLEYLKITLTDVLVSSYKPSPRPLQEDLGTQNLNGAMAHGNRTTINIPAGQIGNNRDIHVVNERWYSDDLQMLVKSVNSDPRFGVTTFQLTNITRTASDAGLFQIPGSYAVTEEQNVSRITGR